MEWLPQSCVDECGGGGGIKDGTKMEGIVLWIEWARWGWKWGNFPRK